ncbi:hypothetical protein Goklo_006727 [Gossypium klotzschianum]|uniref:Uncharacterized protein n=1 Tax=Gossypium klotzschianum TaxID=34286 RepID=A0A7J8VJJ5_9ROSI|nr:hypothetical protein [Gossypium klotzschianum]
MSKAWMGLEKAPEGSFKNKLHGLGLRLLARVKPSEILLKSITKDVTNVQIIYPTRFFLLIFVAASSVLYLQYSYFS